MRFVILVGILLFVSFHANGQREGGGGNVSRSEGESGSGGRGGSAERRNDAGIMADVQIVSDALNCNVFGVQYRHQHSSLIAWRASAGYFDFRQEGGSIALYPFTADTLRSRRVDRYITGIALSAGLEAQRRFYGRLYFYAAGDLRIGYGTAQQDTQHTAEYYGPFQGGYYRQAYSYGTASRDGSGLLVSATLALGARVYAGKRVILGTEFSNPMYYTNSKTGDETARTSDINLSIGRLMQRVYVSWRF